MPQHFDIAVIGAGPGGYVAALKAAQLGGQVAIVEKHQLGGTCLNYGCIPSKALLASAELLHRLRTAAEMGVEVVGQVHANWEKIQGRKDRILATQRSGLNALLTGRKVTVFQGRAMLDGPGKVAIFKNGKSAEQITASKIILAMGSFPSRIPGWPVDAERVCTSDEALHWKTLPRKLLVVGGGVIGCELACAMRAFGVEVTIVEMLPRLLPQMDGELSAAMEKIFVSRGIQCLLGKKIMRVDLTDMGVSVLLDDGKALAADRILVATGRSPNTADMALKSVGLALDRGFLRVDDRMETVGKNYYCIGDANGRCLLAHAASAHGVTAAQNAMDFPSRFTAPVPNCIYTFPEIASVGLTTEEARDQNIPFFAGGFPLKFLGKAQACGEVSGFVKVLRHRETGQLLGVHMIGHAATECIAAAVTLMHHDVSVAEVAEVVFAHPTMSEGIKEAAEDSLHAPLHALPRKQQRIVLST